MADSTAPATEPVRHRTTVGIGRWVRAFAFGVLWMSTLFLGAGTLRWTRGWIFAIVYCGSVAALALAVRQWNPDLMAARLKLRHKDTKAFDRIFWSIHMPLTAVLPGIAGLDAVRFRWSPMPAWIEAPAIVLFLLALALIAWTLKANPWAEQTVRIQVDRNHSVASTGPYRIVRHPMYVGALAMYPAMAGMLGSMMALMVAGLEIVAFVWRTAREDRTLRSELPGYETYASATKYRLVPGIW
jgi:protein-S-isoprenylcysteine O-methyltransferase Ste14